MATYKIMLVEDDNNLRAIYGDRLMAEGYEIVSARDGEEALALAVKEKPDLIISDVMMPKISGFDMLDILRTTPETKDVKVIMMTALSQAEDKERADKLGADKYLVKSQVTLEDVARVVHEVLGDGDLPAPIEPIVTATPPVVAPAETTPQVAPAPVIEPNPYAPNEPTNAVVTATSNPFETPPSAVQATTPPVVASTPVAPVAPVVASPVAVTPAPQEPALTQPVASVAPAPSPVVQSAPVTATPVTPEPVVPAVDPQVSVSAPDPVLSAPADPQSTSAVTPDESSTMTEDQSAGSKRVIQPLTDNLTSDATPKIYELYEKEMAAQAAMSPVENQQASAVIEPPVVTAPAVETSTTPEKPAFDPNSVAL